LGNDFSASHGGSARSGERAGGVELYLVRHAQAIDGHDMADEDRPLTAHGRSQALDVGGALKKAGVRLGHIVSSPLVRAVETAELIAVATGFDGGLGISPAMRPDGSWKHLARELLEPALASGGEARPLALVGHEPSIGHFLSKLLQQKGLSMSKGAVVRLQLRSLDEAATLVWALSPKRLEPAPQLP
jgi:phosphohistidine phosphatase